MSITKERERNIYISNSYYNYELITTVYNQQLKNLKKILIYTSFLFSIFFFIIIIDNDEMYLKYKKKKEKLITCF